MKNEYIEIFDAIKASEEAKEKAVKNMLDAQTEPVKQEKKAKARFVWNMRRVIIAAATAAVILFCAIFTPLYFLDNNTPPVGDTPAQEEPIKPPDPFKPPVKTANLMESITANDIAGKAVDTAFVNGAANFSIDLFKNSFSQEKNSLISPTSVLLALAMTANGADGLTLSQMEAVLAGGLDISTLNEYLYSYINALPSEEKSRLNIANSIWFKETGFSPNLEFLQTNADYYGAAAYKSAFDEKTVTDINDWVKDATEGLIDSILKEIPEEAIMYLINTVLFDAEWARIYETSDIRQREFYAYDGESQTTEFMFSVESKYLEGNNATGFIKPYYGNKYSFAALLPDEDTTIDQFVSSLSGETFVDILKNASSETVYTAMPKFKYDYEILMNDVLTTMGIENAFSPYSADFSKIGQAGGNIYISKVMHKATISVDERGTKAGAVTEEKRNGSGPDSKHVTLDRPFVYAIIDNATSLPIFIGSVLSV